MMLPELRLIDEGTLTNIREERMIRLILNSVY